MPPRLRNSRHPGPGVWSAPAAMLAAIVALTVLPVGTSHAGWLSDLFSSKQDQKAKTAKAATAAKPAHAPPSEAQSKPEAVAKPEAAAKPAEPAKPHVAEKEHVARIEVPKCEPAKFHLVVDVGHTFKSDGAMSARNVPEFTFNLRLATRLVQKLKSEGFTWTRLMVTEGGARPSLIKRVATANASGADLFLSIHHDSVPDKFMEKWDFEGKKLEYSDHFSGWSLFVSRENANYDASLAFARMIGKRMRAQKLHFADQYSLPVIGARYRHDLLDKDDGVYRYDHLVVLMTTHMPAVLLEAGSISNRDEELQMASVERQDMIVGAVTAAVKEYCGPLPVPPRAEPLLNAKRDTPDSNGGNSGSQRQFPPLQAEAPLASANRETPDQTRGDIGSQKR